MDPITAAIIGALAAGVTKSAGKVAESAIVDGYNALKAAIKRKLGDDNKVSKAVADAEANPDSKARQAVLEEEVAASKAAHDADILKAAQELQIKLGAGSNQGGVIQTIQATNAAVSGTGPATFTMNTREDKDA